MNTLGRGLEGDDFPEMHPEGLRLVRELEESWLQLCCLRTRHPRHPACLPTALRTVCKRAFIMGEAAAKRPTSPFPSFPSDRLCKLFPPHPAEVNHGVASWFPSTAALQAPPHPGLLWKQPSWPHHGERGTNRGRVGGACIMEENRHYQGNSLFCGIYIVCIQ